jgi:hypothetical protein
VLVTPRQEVPGQRAERKKDESTYKPRPY